MRKTFTVFGVTVVSTVLMVLPTAAQQGGGGAAGAGAAGVGAGANVSGSASTGVQQQPQAGQTDAGVPSGASTTTDVTPPAAQPQQPQQFAATNSGAGVVGTNASGDQSAPQPVSPTSRPGGTNVVYATNSASMTNTPEWLQRDQAITAQDQAMLQQMRQAVFQGQPTANWMQSIHFILKDGAVRIVGTVPSPAERQRIESIVAQIPGVVRVYDAVAVNASAGADAGAANGSANGNATANPPTPTGSFAPTNIGDSVPPNSRFTNIIYETGQQPK